MVKHLGIIGYPLAHSISPAFQQAALDNYGLPVRYEAWPTAPEALRERVGSLRGGDYLGANVTIPHKERVAQMVDSVDSWAQVVGAVNTIVKTGRDLVGYNTDADGFLRSLRKDVGFEPRGGSVLVLGAGGAARAAVFGLAREGVAGMTIANRTLDRAQSLAAEVSDSVAEAGAVALGDESAVRRAAAGAQLIVNATSMGMSHGEGEGSTPLKADLIPPSALVYDMVYTPRETPLMIEAQKVGARAIGGLSMLVYQGAASFELWTEREAPVRVMFHAAEKALSAQTA